MGFFDWFRRARTPQPPTQQEYAEIIMSGLRESGDTRAWTYEEQRGRLTETMLAPGVFPSFINLPNLHKDYIDAGPEGRKECLRRQVGALMQQFIPPTFAEAKAKLRPVIRSTTERGIVKLQSHGNPAWSEPAYRPLCESVEIALVYDGEFNMMRLTEAKLAQWGVAFDEAFDVAIDNLRLESSKPWLAMQNGVFLSQFGDFYDAPRLLLPDVLYRQPIAGAPVVMAPNRAVLLLTGDRNEAGMQTIVELAEQALAQTRPLPPLMLRWSGTAWEKFIPEALAGTLHRLRLRELAADYQDQHVALNEILQREGQDIVVAQHTIAQRENGEQFSYSVWAEGAHSLLPDTDFVALHRASTKQIAYVPRSELKQALGSLINATEHLPLRYEVDRFPDDDVFQRLHATFSRIPESHRELNA
jgi:hypothetical protein